jgi:hypothetical protein
MLARLHDIPEDWIYEQCERAFTKIGSEAVIANFANEYATSEEFERMSIACTLEGIHSDQSVQACLDFLKLEKDDVIRGILLEAVLFNFATEGIDLARQFILETPPNPDVLEVRSTLLTSCTLTGERFPEFDAWLKE